MRLYPMQASLYLVIGLIFLTISQALSQIKTFQIDQKKVEAIENEILQRVITPQDGELQVEVKTKLVIYLVETTLSDYVLKNRGNRQDDGDDAAEGAAEGGEQVYMGVRRLLQNVFAGNLIGVIQESVSIRSPARVQDFFSDVMGALFGSNAVKGAGTIGLPTTTVSPNNGTIVAGSVGVPLNGVNGANNLGNKGTNSINTGFQNTNIGAGSSGGGSSVTKTNTNIDSEDELDEIDDF